MSTDPNANNPPPSDGDTDADATPLFTLQELESARAQARAEAEKHFSAKASAKQQSSSPTSSIEQLVQLQIAQHLAAMQPPKAPATMQSMPAGGAPARVVTADTRLVDMTPMERDAYRARHGEAKFRTKVMAELASDKRRVSLRR